MQRMTFEQANMTWQAMAKKTPLVHCMTNQVAAAFTANVLLAAGASPAMVTAPEEVQHFTPLAANLLINVGTLQRDQLDGMREAAEQAQKHHKPWVLDPVAVGDVLRFRRDFVYELLTYQPAVIRGNAGEILFLAGESGRIRGADSLSSSDEAQEAAQALAKRYRCVVVVTGARDYITDGALMRYTEGGSVLQTRVTACGCTLSALVAAFVAEGNVLDHAAAACAVMKHAGDLAAAQHTGLGSFAQALLDGLTYE
ncbi:hydroxyethylthiazole kinase [Suttonella sp. R2A3]|uniref:hydroxyethylthiazole kinase n=1 Tax=Suttonella sp. R2A3 TaxID=2908648 RepID=UPI001F305EDF|nr:hydroxyethylthiazole kinase [Suttonella sp. R2A3]UJF25011.1 hydroxyethylthiazole kinase [Suttonella sp. R2A3]